MSIKDLFNNKAITYENAATASQDVESKDFILTKIKQQDTFQPFIDYATASNFAKFGSALEYYRNSIERIYGEYPYDGSDREKILFELSSSYLDKYIFDKRYPKTNGYIQFSYGGWGTAASITDGFGLPNSSTDYEYIFTKGGIHTASSGMENIPLYKVFDKSVIYDSSKDRVSSFQMKMNKGFTIEFWLKKAAFDIAKTKKEVILDLWNGNAYTTPDYGRFTLALSGTTYGDNTFIATLQSGTYGFYEQAIGTSTITTSSLADWHHYAFSFISSSVGVTSRIYKDGDLNEKKTLGTTGLNDIGGLINGYIGALQTSPSASSAAQYSGKLSASLDDFRFWKTRRTSRQIYNNWYRHVGGGTNTDDANIKLGLYYKFNEGITSDSNIDSTILDYSGRLANGSWFGYSSGARSTNSAFVESGLFASEDKDPIIHSSHPTVVSLKTELETSGSQHDEENPAILYNKIPQWIRDEDTKNVTKHLIQIMSSYFDTLYAQITALPDLKSKTFPSSSYRPLPFADRLLLEKGLVVPNLFIDSSLLEKFGQRDLNKVQYEKELEEVKNLIYTNIYNNLEAIYKSKGTESSIRNMLRCFGIDDEIVRLNIYTDNGTHYLNDKHRHSSVDKKYINFNLEDHFSATIYQTSSVSYTDTYMSGTSGRKSEKHNALTFEASIIVPQKLGVFDRGYFDTNFLSSSIFGLHQAQTSSAVYTWATEDAANFQVYLVRDKLASKDAKFVLKNYNNTINLQTDFFKDIYSNEKWNIAVRIKPNKEPYSGKISQESEPSYKIEFYGVTHAFDVVKDEFILSASLNYVTGSNYLSQPKRAYAGSHRQDFTGTVLEKSDLKIGRIAAWFSYLDNSTIKTHNLDVHNKGTKDPYSNSTLFGDSTENYHIPTYESNIFNWDFENLTTSDASGEFIVDDVSSGSMDSRYGWADGIIRREHRAKGTGFTVSSTKAISKEFVFCSIQETPELSVSSDGVTIKGEKEKHFIKDEDVSDNFYALEKSMYQVISKEMLKMFSSIQAFSNLHGEAVERYRLNYKKLDHMRRLFFENVESDMDFDRFTEYFKWIDSSVSYMVDQLFPASVRRSNGISNVIESHILERNKYQNKIPLVETVASTEGSMHGSSFLKYKWKFGHSPISGNENDNCLWQKERKIRTDISDREALRKILVNHNNATASLLARSNRVSYLGSTYATRRFSKPYSLSQDLKPTIHGGTNYSVQKDRDYIYNATHKHGPRTSIGVPKNVLVVGIGEGQGIELPRVCNDVEEPNPKKKFNVKAYTGKFAGNPITLPFNDSGSYIYGVKGEHRMPMNIISGNVSSGYNRKVATGYKSDAVFTNLHSDTTNISNDVPLQGPFPNAWVGGHQARHVEINKYDTSLRDDYTGNAPPNNIDNQYTRPEAWRLLFVEKGAGADGAFGFAGPDYGSNYPDVDRKSAVYYRDGRAKRPFNMKNIQTTTASQNHGNYSQLYEVISMGGKIQNNPYFVKNSDQSRYLADDTLQNLPQTTHPMSLVGQAPFVSGNVFGTHSNNRQPDTTQLNIIAPVSPVASSGSLRVFGVDHVTDGHSWKISGTTVYGNNIGFEIDDDSSATLESIDSTGTDNQMWDEIETFLSARFTTNVTRVSASYGNMIQVTAKGTKVSASAPASGLTPITDGYAVGMYINMDTNMVTGNQGFLYVINSTTGSGYSRAAWVETDGTLKVREWGVDAGNGSNKDRRWEWSNFHSTYRTTMINLVITRTNGDVSSPAEAYVNGASLGAATSSGYSGIEAAFVNNAPDDVFTLFDDPSDTGNSNNFLGFMDEFVYFNRKLTSGEIVELYNGGLKQQPGTHSRASNVKLYYDFESFTASDGNTINAVTGSINVELNTSNYSKVNSTVLNSKSYALFSITGSSTFGANGNVTPTVVGTSIHSASVISGGVTEVLGNVRKSKDIVQQRVTGSNNKYVISSRFSAPGGPEVQSYGYLDAYSQEYSVHNSLNYRNLTVRASGSGESSTIRADDHLGRRFGLRTHLRRHSGQFGIDPVYGQIVTGSYATQPSFHKINRNTRRQPLSGASSTFTIIEKYDNAYVTSPIPRSDFQYSWVTASLGYTYSVDSGKQRIYGYSPRDGILSSSVVINGESGFVSAIVFPTASEIFGE